MTVPRSVPLSTLNQFAASSALNGSFVPFTTSPDSLLWSSQKTMHTVKTSFATTERYEDVAIEAAAVLAPRGPLGVVTMGTFPLSLIAFGWISRQQSDDPIAARRAG